MNDQEKILQIYRLLDAQHRQELLEFIVTLAIKQAETAARQRGRAKFHCADNGFVNT